MRSGGQPLLRQEVFGPEAGDFGRGDGHDGASLVDGVAGIDAGKAVGFGLFDTLAILGRGRCLARIDRALKIAENP